MKASTSSAMQQITEQVDSLTPEQAQQVWLTCQTYVANARARAAKERAAKALLTKLFGEDVVSLPVERYSEAADLRLNPFLFEPQD